MPETPAPQKRGRGRPSLGLSKEGHVLVKMQPALKRKMDQTAAAAQISANELVRRAVTTFCEPDTLEKLLMVLEVDDQEREKEHRNEQARKSAPSRRRPK